MILGAGLRGFFLSDLALNLGKPGLSKLLRVEGQRAHEQLVQHDTERIHVGPSIDVLVGHLGLLGTHVLRCADQLS